MERMLQEIREEVQDLHDGIDTEEGEEAQALKKTAEYFLTLMSRSELQKEARKRTELAIAVMEFAEWQKEGYIEDDDTRKIISESLWDRVSENVRDVLQRTPPIPPSG